MVVLTSHNTNTAPLVEGPVITLTGCVRSQPER
jgi:hypothetical protein